MKKILTGLLAFVSVSAFATKSATRSTEIHQLLLSFTELQSIPLSHQLAFGEKVVVTEITLSGKDYESGCYKRAKVTYQGEASHSSWQERNLKECIKF